HTGVEVGVVVEPPLAHAAERSEEVAKAEPEAFHRVVVNLAYAVAVVVARVLAAAVIHGGVGAARGGGGGGRGPSRGQGRGGGAPTGEDDEGFERTSRTAEGLPHHGFSGLAPEGTEDRRAVVLERAVAVERMGAAAWRVAGIRMPPALFPGILVQRVDLDDRV